MHHLRRELWVLVGGVWCAGCPKSNVQRFGIGLRLGSRCGRSVARWVGHRQRSGPMWWLAGFVGHCRLRSGRRWRLSLGEREEITRGLTAGESLRGIANRLGRASSTVSREVAGTGGRRKYRATTAHRVSRHRAPRGGGTPPSLPGPGRTRSLGNSGCWSSGG